MKVKSNRNNKLFIITLFIVFCSSSCSNIGNNPDLVLHENAYEKIDEVITTLYENEQFSGVVLVSVRGKVLYKKAVGYANLEDSIPNTIDTKFRIASFTKPFTIILILQLVEDGSIELNDKLTDYLPEYNVKGGDEITIYQLLTHTAGIIGHTRISNLEEIEKKHYSKMELLNLINSYDLVHRPGDKWEYSNFGFSLLALLIEKVTNKNYDEVMQERICKPAGMTNTLSDITEIQIEKRAVGYTHYYFTGIGEAPYLDMSFCFGYGHLLSTAEDLYLFDKALYTNTILSQESKELFFNKFGWLYTNHPFGIKSKKIRCNNLEGSINGFQSHTQRIEKDTVLIVALRNIKEEVYENEIAIKWPSSIDSPILSILYNEEYKITKKSSALVVFKTIIDKGQSDAVSIFHNIKDKQDKYYIDIDEFVFFEKELRNKNMNDEAETFQSFIQEIEEISQHNNSNR